MSTTQRTTNTFQLGMVQDVDKHLQPKGTYRYLFGGRIMFNTNTDLPVAERYSEGTTFALTNEPGNKLLFSACDGYILVGSVDLEDECISMWTNGLNSEIRTFKINDLGEVFDNYVLFNDRFDFNEDLLHFNPEHYIQGYGIVENSNLRRIYTCDNKEQNQPRVFNIELFYREYIDHTDGDKIKKLPWHWVWDETNPDDPQPVSQPLCDTSVSYPHWLSVHSFDLATDVIYPRIKFLRRLIDGSTANIPDFNQTCDFAIDSRCSLKTGIFQYFVRYETKDHYKTPVSPITDHIFLSSKFKDKHNHLKYTMYTSNVVTDFGIELVIDGLDTRYHKIEIGYIYSIGKKEINEVNIFQSILLTPGTTSINVQHINHTGIPMSRDEVLARYQTIIGCNTIGSEKNKAFFGGIKALKDIEFNVENVSIRPHFRLMDGDQSGENDTSLEPEMIEDVSYPGTPEPATNSFITSKTLSMSAFTGETIDFEIDQDYENYKGMQFEHLFKGDWRGEVYGYGIYVIDRKGNPLFVKHMKDFKFPEQYEPGYDNITDSVHDNANNLTYFNTDKGRYELKIMGAMISGLRLPKDVIFDKFGKLNISGFRIVRNERKPRILHQGLLLNCVHEENCKQDKDPDYEEDVTRPLPYLSNLFAPNFYTHDSNLYSQLGRCSKRDKVCKIDSLYILNRPHTFTYECPDLFISGETPVAKDADYIKIVGTCHMAYGNDNIELDGSHDQFYTKSYKTDNAENRYPLGSESRLHDVWKFYSREQRKPYDKDNTELTFTNDIWGVFIVDGAFTYDQMHVYPTKVCPGSPPNTSGIDCFPDGSTLPGNGGPPVTGDLYLASDVGEVYKWNGSAYILQNITEFLWRPALYASGHANTIALKCKDFMNIDIAENENSKSSYHIVNYLRPNDTYYNDESEAALEVRQYIGTNHFQPIDNNILFKAKKVMKDGSIINGSEVVDENEIEFYQFDDVEVWGGDCFLQFTDFTRLLPYYHGTCDKCSGYLLDFSVSHIVPLESNFNTMMRYGRSFAKNGTQAQAVSCNNVDKHFVNGIMDRQPEDWNINEVMQHQNNFEKFSSKPTDVSILEDVLAVIYYSLNKTFGELQDRYRKVLRLNYSVLDGINGDITGFINNFGSLYCFQEKAFGSLRINERVAVPTELDAKLFIGDGGNLDGIDYISTIYGCQHRDGILRMNNAIYWPDARMGKFCRFAQDGNSLLSDANEVHDVATLAMPYFEKEKFINDKVVKIIAARDYVNNDVIYTFYNNDSEEISSFTISMNETLNKYTGYNPYTPRIYMHYKSFVFCTNPNQQHEVYIQGKGKRGHYFGEYFKTILKYIINDNAGITKAFDNSLINVNKTGHIRIGTVVLKTQNQTHFLNLKMDRRAKYYEDKLRYPMREDAYHNDRVRGHYVEVTIEIDNEDQLVDNEDLAVVITSIDTEFRFSNKL